MKKWMYVISLGAMLAVWLAIYFPAKKATEQRLAAEQAAVQRQKDEDDARLKVTEEKAKEDADRRAAERARQEAEQEAEAQRRWDADSASIQAETDRAAAQIAHYNQQISYLDHELDYVHKTTDQANRDDFELTKQVELARVAEFRAEMEIQRMVDMIATRADQSAMANPVIPPPASN